MSRREPSAEARAGKGGTMTLLDACVAAGACSEGLTALRAHPEVAAAPPTPWTLGVAYTIPTLRPYVGWALGRAVYPPDLRGANLQGADLREASLRWADLRGASLRWADLRGADLRGADLGGADLGGADLRWADLRGVDLRGVDLRWALLEGALLEGEAGGRNDDAS